MVILLVFDNFAKMVTSTKYKGLVKFSLHLLTWVLLLLLPYLLSNNENFDLARIINYTWTPMFFYAILFYINYFYLVDKFLFKKKWLIYLVSNFCLIILFIWLHFELREFLNSFLDLKILDLNGKKRVAPPISLFIYKDIISMIIPMIISFALRTTEAWAKKIETEKEKEKELLNSELQHLRYQLQPHFFFNSLNTVYALIERSPALAQTTVHDLSKLMRYMLYDAETVNVNLTEEVHFMEKYINLMKLRISDKTTVSFNFIGSREPIQITPLLFISLIENAFKHGISASMESTIVFNLSCKGKTVFFESINTNFPKSETDKSGSGIGLSNLSKRLELLYPNKYFFEQTVGDGNYVVKLQITTN